MRIKPTSNNNSDVEDSKNTLKFFLENIAQAKRAFDDHFNTKRRQTQVVGPIRNHAEDRSA